MPDVTITVPDDLPIAHLTVHLHMGEDTDRALFDRIAERHGANVREPDGNLTWAHADWTADGTRYELYGPTEGSPGRTTASVGIGRA